MRPVGDEKTFRAEGMFDRILEDVDVYGEHGN
jgi:hypothetical protein